MHLRLFLLLAIAIASAAAEKFKVIREWKYLNFTWPSPELREAALADGSYVPENNIIAGIDYFDGYYYLTVPRMKSGVPATLARIPGGRPGKRDAHPPLEPFPSWEMNRAGDCEGFQNVQNLEIDPKGQAWIIDSGRTETLNHPVSRCPPKLVIYDVKNNATVTMYTFPENVVSRENNFLYDLVIDDTDGGYAYITDNSAKDPGIVVFSVKSHTSWKIRHPQSMRADPSAVTFRVNGVVINSPLNVAGVALGPKIHTSAERIVIDEDRELYYSPISSMNLFSINTSALRNEQRGLDNAEYKGDVKDYGRKASQSAGMIMDNKGVLYYTLLGTYSIAKWDSHTPFESKQRIISKDPKYLEWPNSFCVDSKGNLTVLVNRMNKFIYDRINVEEENFRLITSFIDAKGYLFNDNYEYGIDLNVTTPPPASSRPPEPEVLPGSDNDPYLVPHPIPEKPQTSSTTDETSQSTDQTMNSSSEVTQHTDNSTESSSEAEPEPTPEPEPEPEPTPEPEPGSPISMITSRPIQHSRPVTSAREPQTEPSAEPSSKPSGASSEATNTEPVTETPGAASSAHVKYASSWIAAIVTGFVGLTMFVSYWYTRFH
ncbi:unnamed protein product [Phyllotreta striolata]|uniref:Major royal jelly protein n=1 Tax=Phyllotreta striolata TaxID=444603 RepID=A0A9N9XPE7_PHYSR|nr:unnamed protein product [Phyllotreta striolata]